MQPCVSEGRYSLIKQGGFAFYWTRRPKFRTIKLNSSGPWKTRFLLPPCFHFYTKLAISLTMSHVVLHEGFSPSRNTGLVTRKLYLYETGPFLQFSWSYFFLMHKGNSPWSSFCCFQFHNLSCLPPPGFYVKLPFPKSSPNLPQSSLGIPPCELVSSPPSKLC